MAETCASPDDEDCDGHDCARWAAVFGDEKEQQPTGIAVDKDGNAIVVGIFAGALPFQDPALLSAGNHDIFVAKFDPSGKVLWSKRFGDAVDQTSAHVATDSKGNVIVAGAFQGTINLGGQDLFASGTDIYVGKFDPSGAPLWSKKFGGVDTQNVVSVGVDAGDNLFLTGAFRADLDLGKGTMTATCCDFDVYAGKLDADGNCIWSKRFGDAAGQFLDASTVDLSGSAILTGDFSGVINFGGVDLTAGPAGSDYAARLDGNGGFGWSRPFPSSGLTFGAVASDGLGKILLSGTFAGSLDFGNGAIVSDGAGVDVFVAKVDSAGFPTWSKPFVTTGASAFVTGLGTDGAGNVVLTVWGNPTVDFGGGALGGPNEDTIFLAKLDSSGQHQWSRSFLGRSSVIAVAPGGDIVLAGKVSGSVDVGTGPLPANFQDLLITRFAP